MKIAFPTDEHVPFHDKRAVELARKIVADFQPDLITAGSDALDFYNISHFDKNPERVKVRLQDEIDAWKSEQKAWNDAAPNARKKFIKGNHEDRLRKYLWRHPEIASLEVMTLASVLGLDGLGIEYENGDYGNEEIVLDGLVLKHGRFVRKGSGMSARAELENEHFSISILTGHTHRGGSFYARTRDGLVQAHECFCLCRLDPEYVHRPDWQQGIVLAEVTKTSIMVEPIPFNDFRRRKVAYWRGKEYTA